MGRQVFISYSHDDRSWFDRLKLALAPFEDARDIAVLDDTQIPPGGRWAEIIESYLASADVAVVLTSANLLASRFVKDVELPAIVEAAKSGRLTLVWAAVSSSSWKVTELQDFQAALDPDRPLDLMGPGEANAALVTLAQAVASARTLTQIGRSLSMVDKIAEATADKGALPPRVLARHTGVAVNFEERFNDTPIDVITGEDLNALPTSEHILVRALEESMESSFERWTGLRARSNRLTGRERVEYSEAGQQMCGELRNILNFIEYQLGKYLDDHYHAIRYACDSLVTPPN
jgi:hypothetical protein